MSDIIDSKQGQVEEIPAFLREKLRAEYGEAYARIETGFRAKRAVTLRANTLKTSAEAVASALTDCGIGFSRPSWYRDAFILNGVSEHEIMRLPFYVSGEIYLQSLSSMLPPLVLEPREGEAILDMTAAPGGKTSQMSALSGGKALLTACEKDPVRFERLKFNLSRQGVPRVNAMHVDALRLDDFFRFDKILLDAPCSGSGTIGFGQPNKIGEKLVKGCLSSQRALLKKAAGLLKRGGRLVYSTCSLLKEENEEQLSGLDRFELIPVPSFDVPSLPGMERTLTVCPDAYYEGFFLCVLQKK